MNVMGELHDSLRAMGFVQLLLTQLFLASYALALGGFTGPKGRLRAALAALLSAVAFVALSPRWEHGALLVALAVGGLGLFVATVALLSALLGVGRSKVPAAAPVLLEEDLPDSLPEAASVLPGTAAAASAAATLTATPLWMRLRRKRATA